MKPTPELAQALTNLRSNHDFEVVLAAFARAREVARDQCETLPADEKLYRAQGEAAFLKSFFKLNEAAPKDLDLFKRKK